MIGQKIGVSHYRLPMKDNPASMPYEDRGGPDYLDHMSERF